MCTLTHRLREGLVRLAGDGTERHGSGVEALHDLADWLDLVQGYRQRGLVLEAEQTPAKAHTKKNKENKLDVLDKDDAIRYIAGKQHKQVTQYITSAENITTPV